MASAKRHLLPKASPRPLAESLEVSPRKKRTGVRIACNLCRKRKLRCNGQRPKCANCRDNIQDCFYDYDAESGETRTTAIKRKYEVLAQLFDLLRSQPEEIASDALRYIRHGASSENILKFVEGQMVHETLASPPETNMALHPPGQTSFEFQLLVQHPNAYPHLISLDLPSLPLTLLGIKTLRTSAEKNATCAESAETLPQEWQDPGFELGSASTINPKAMLRDALFHSNKYVDDRLARMEIRRWTNVAVSNHFAAEAISLYLEVHQPWWGLLDVDLFLDDLVSGSTKYCSQLLVNALMAWSSQSYANYEPTAATMSNHFLDEALRLYHEAHETESLTTVVAAILICMTWTTAGTDKRCHLLMSESIDMAKRLHLYDVPAGSQIRGPLDFTDSDLAAAASATAWASFCFEMLMSLSYRRPPLIMTKPELPIPGDLLAANSSRRALPVYLGTTTVSVCKFWALAHKMISNYFDKKDVSLSVAIPIFQDLLAWADELSLDVTRGNHSKDHVIGLHIWFHIVVIDVFRPFFRLQPQPKLPIFRGDAATPAAVVSASIKQLKRLILIYRSTFESANFSINWQRGMLYLLNYILHDCKDEEATFYFLRCMRGYQSLMRCLPLVDGIVKGLLAVAVRSGTIMPPDAREFFDEIQNPRTPPKKFISKYPVDLDLASTDPEAAGLDNLAHHFSEVVFMETRGTPWSDV